MLQRAASNAYSWWWAGHIRTKQTKWLEQNLMDMEEKVDHALTIIQEEGDSFAKRAEMYYKRRPELVGFVEDFFRAYKALAVRYDHISTELQNANNTLATCFPDQIDLTLSDDDEDGPPNSKKSPQNPAASNAPKVPKAPIKELKRLVSAASKQLHEAKSFKKDEPVVKSGLTEEMAVKEIDRLEKDILTLQTEKEYVKVSYQNGLEKYWSIENQIMEKQQRVCNLQDEFDVAKVIEDEDARKLMAEAALQSCQDTLADLQETQRKSVKEAREGYKKIEDSRARLNSFKQEVLDDQSDGGKSYEKDESVNTSRHTPSSSQDLGEVIEHETILVEGETVSITVTQLVEKIDHLVHKVISLETSVSTQTALVDRLKTESSDLSDHITILENEKETLTQNNQDLIKRVKELEEMLKGAQDLTQTVENQNNKIESHFVEAQSSINNLSEKISTAIAVEDDTQENEEEEEDDDDEDEKNTKPSYKKSVTWSDPKAKTPSKFGQGLRKLEETDKQNKVLDWQKMLLSGVDDKERFLLIEYSSVLRNYKDLKMKLSNMEKKERENQFDFTMQIKELKYVIAKKDDEISQLRRKLNASGDENVNEGDSIVSENTKQEEKIKHEEDIDTILAEKSLIMSPIEETLRITIDEILDENLDFWLRFSASYHQIEKFRTTVEDLREDISQIKEKKQREEAAKNTTIDFKSEIRPIYKHLKEIHTELKVWLTQTTPLQDELERRFSSLCNVQDKISITLKEGIEEVVEEEDEEIKFSSHQAAKYMGEILNMKQENTKIREELQAGIDHITSLQTSIESNLIELDDEFELTIKQQPLGKTSSKNKIPLRSFIFGTKPKKQKHSIFSYIHPNKKYQVLRASLHM